MKANCIQTLLQNLYMVLAENNNAQSKIPTPTPHPNAVNVFAL